MLAFLFSLINPLSSIVGKIADAKVELAKAQTDEERIHAQERISTLQSRRDVMVAEAQGPFGWINSLMRGLLALGPTVYLLKIFIWDKVLQSVTHGSTDPLDANLWYVVMVVLGFYFLDSMTSKLTRK